MCALQIEVPEFAGPLDLLLNLIQRRRLDVTALSLAAVADQYLEQVLALEGELDALSEFLVVASQLLVIKSRALLPTVEAADVVEDPAEELRRRLAEYQVLQAAAQWLATREADGCRTYGRGSELLAPTSQTRLAPVPPNRLLQVLLMWSSAPLTRPDGTATLDTLPRPSLRERVAVLLDALPDQRWRPIAHLVGADVATAVATFLALLILVRHGVAEIRQRTAYAPLEVRRACGDRRSLPDPEW